MSSNRKTIDFGCPNEIDPHHFIVHIPRGRKSEVTITEHFGLLGGSDGIPERVDRAVLSRSKWRAVAEVIKRLFNERLRAKKCATGRWKTGDNKLDRLLGKEICILAWAIENMESDRVPTALRNWMGLKPEERWWLFAMTAARSGKVDDGERGWRRALQFALSER